MKILILGGEGQLGQSIKKVSERYPRIRFLYTGEKDLDICNEEQLSKYILKNKVDTLINCAAYTAVDKAEEQVDESRLVNKDGVGNIGRVSRELGVNVIHVSTDYVFDGKANLPYTEADKPNPQTVYGLTKHEGEILLQLENPSSIIVRTSWLYSEFGNNFVKTIARLAGEKDELKVVFDQVGTPCYAPDLAEALLQVAEQADFITDSGIYHFSNEGVCSWYDLAVSISSLMNIPCKIIPVRSDAFPTVAQRPNFSVLDKAKIKSTFDIPTEHWQQSLRQCLILLYRSNKGLSDDLQ